MNATLLFFACVISLTALAGGVIVSLRRPLLALLTELCGGEERGRFWTRTYYAALLLTTLFSALIVPPDPGRPAGFLEAVHTFRAGVFGLLLSLGILTAVALRFITRRPGREVRSVE